MTYLVCQSSWDRGWGYAALTRTCGINLKHNNFDLRSTWTCASHFTCIAWNIWVSELYRATRVKWRKIWPLSLISSTEVYWPSCQIDIFSPHPRLYTHTTSSTIKLDMTIPQIKILHCESGESRSSETSERAGAEQPTIGPKFPSREYLVSVFHKNRSFASK